MKKYIKLCIISLAALLCFPVISGCKRESEGLTKVSVCEVTHSIFYAPQYVAINNGFFEEEGIEIELSNGQGSDSVASAVLSGDIDIGFAGPETAIYVYNEGRENYMEIFAQITKRDGSFLVAREEDDNFTWDKLKGKHILPGRKGGSPYMTLQYVIRNAGLDIEKDLEFDDSIKFELMASAFTSGTGDYVTIFEPTASMLEQEGKGSIVASVGAQTEEIPYTTYLANKSFIEENQDLIQRFTNAVYKAQKWVEEHSAEEIAQMIAPSFPDTDLEIIENSVNNYKEIDVWKTEPMMTEESFELLQKVISEAGELDEKAPYDQIINNSFGEKAVS